MIDGNHNSGYTLVCDHCDMSFGGTFETFREAVDYKQDEGWANIKDRGGIWHELCPDCATAENKRHYRRMA